MAHPHGRPVKDRVRKAAVLALRRSVRRSAHLKNVAEGYVPSWAWVLKGYPTPTGHPTPKRTGIPTHRPYFDNPWAVDVGTYLHRSVYLVEKGYMVYN